MNPKVDHYIRDAKRWREELGQLRAILLDCPLQEEWKWNKPCYMAHGANIVLMIGFKDYCSLLFCKGSLLKDAKKILVKAGENTQAARQIRFTTVQEIVKLKATLKAYLLEAIAVEKAGLEVDYTQNRELVFPEELQNKLAKTPALKKAFAALTPGRQRAYNIYFTAAKQSTTRESRIESCVPKILCGKGFNDCVCGLTKKKPYCDGSHKNVR